MIPAVRVLLLIPSQYLRWRLESSYHEFYVPISTCGTISDIAVFDYTFERHQAGYPAMLAKLRGEVDSRRPDVIVYLSTHPNLSISPSELADLRGGGAKLLVIFQDTQNLPTEDELTYFRAADGVMIGESLYSYIRFRLLADFHQRGKTVLYLPGHNVTPDLFHPGDGPKRYDMTHVGSVYKQRDRYLIALSNALGRHGIELTRLGGLFELDERVDGGRVREAFRPARAHLPIADYAQALRDSKASVVVQPHPAAHRMRGKTFEILASGCLCVAEDIKEYALTLPREVYVAIGAPDRIDELAALFADGPELARRAKAGADWFRDTFDCRRFWAETLEAVREGGSPELRNPMVRSAFETLRDEVVAHFKGPPGEGQIANLGLL